MVKRTHVKPRCNVPECPCRLDLRQFHDEWQFVCPRHGVITPQRAKPVKQVTLDEIRDQRFHCPVHGPGMHPGVCAIEHYQDGTEDPIECENCGTPLSCHAWTVDAHPVLVQRAMLEKQRAKEYRMSRKGQMRFDPERGFVPVDK